jgi:transcriptional regulator with XRE-family HTH domain
MGFKENLRRLREQAGLTQAEMANRARVPFRSYQNWEAGSREPRIKALVSLAAAFGVSLDDLVGVRRPAPEPKPKPEGRRGRKAKGE